MEDKGSVLYDANDELYTVFPARKVDVYDTSRAGDVFAGVIASQMSQGIGLRTALKKATLASSIKVSHAGGYDAIPSIEDIEEVYNATQASR